MLLIEYRVCLPLSVDEYQVAQLYMIMKKSRLESDSPGARVEILKNEPYYDGPGSTCGQYTKKHYHIGERLPRWATSIITKPVLEEEAWNAYPYTKTQYTCHQAPSMIKDSFSLTIETKYLNDIGNSENVFNLTQSELRQRKVYHLDMVNDYNDVYIEKEDPLVFKSEKTGRGPLSKTWIKDREGAKDILCAYKLCRIRFDNYFFGQKVEHDLIHERALKKTLLHAHRQAWCWQDEYYGMDIETIRKLEAEAAEELARRFASPPTPIDGGLANGGKDLNKSSPVSAIKKQEKRKSFDSQPDEDTSCRIQQTDGQKDLSSREDKHKLDKREKTKISGDSVRNKSIHSENGHGHESRQRSHTSSVETIKSSTNTERLNGESRLSGDEDADDDFDDVRDRDLFKTVVSSGDDLDGGREGYESGGAVSDFFISDSELEDKEKEKKENRRWNNVDRCSESEEEDEDDEFYDAVSQQLWSSTLALDYEADNNHGSNHQFMISGETERSYYDSSYSSSSTEGANTKNVIISITGDSLFKCDKTDSADYQQSFQENVSKIMQRFFHTSSCSTIVESFSLSSSLIASLQSQLAMISTNFDVNTCNKSPNSPGSSGDNVSYRNWLTTMPMQLASLFLTKQPSYYSHAAKTCERLNSFVADVRSQYEEEKGVDLEVTLICDNLGSVLLHDIITGFSCAQTPKGDDDIPMPMKLNFDIFNVYYLGSSLGHVLSFYNFKSHSSLPFSIFNMFFQMDTCAARLEPFFISDSAAAAQDAAAVANQENMEPPFQLTSYQDLFKFGSERNRKLDLFPDVRGRIDLQLCCGHNAEDQSFMELVSKIRGIHSLYWESFDVAFFVVSNFTAHAMFNMKEAAGATVDLSHYQSVATSLTLSHTLNGTESSAQTSSKHKFDHKFALERDQVEKSSARKAKSFPPVHVLNDMAVLAGSEFTTVTGRFGYRVGVFISKLSKEPVEILIQKEYSDFANSETEWTRIGMVHTMSNGRLYFNYNAAMDLKVGLYTLRAVCQGDGSSASATLCVLPSNGAQAVIFSIDGTFADSVSITGSNSKLRNSSVELVKFWSALGYFIIYASARPNIMKQVVKSWLNTHGFPQSLCLFVEGLSTPDKNMSKKQAMIDSLQKSCQLTVFAAYGAPKDVSMYRNLGVTPERTFIFPDRMSHNWNNQSAVAASTNSAFVTIPRHGIALHLADLKLQSQQLTARAPLHFAIQSSRKSVAQSTSTMRPTSMVLSGGVLSSVDTGAPSNKQIVLAAKSPGIRTKLIDAFSKRSTVDGNEAAAVRRLNGNGSANKKPSKQRSTFDNCADREKSSQDSL